MYEQLKNKSLFNMDETIAKDIFQDITFPWEVLPLIKDFIIKLGATLPEDEYEHPEENVWIAKATVILLFDIAANLVFLSLNMLGGVAVFLIYEIPISISLIQATAGIFCIIVASMWEIPVCLWLKKVGAFATVVINAGIGSFLGVALANTKFWIFCPYSWISRLMVPAIGILPNGVPVSEEAGNLPVPVAMIVLALLFSVILSFTLLRLSAKSFSQQEVK